MKKQLLGILSFLFLLAAPLAHAGLIPSDAAVKPSGDRERVQAILARPDVQKELEKSGIAPADAKARVQAMSDSEVGMLAGRLDALPAGAAITNDELLLIIVIILLVALLI